MILGGLVAYTIIEVERKTGVNSRKLRFWADKGLFPFVEKDKNGVRYFSEQDLQWVIWIDCFRQIGMSIPKIKDYIKLCAKGSSTMPQRLSIILNERQKVINELTDLQNILQKLDYKAKYYSDMIEKSKDELNPLSKDYAKIKTKRRKIKSH